VKGEKHPRRPLVGRGPSPKSATIRASFPAFAAIPALFSGNMLKLFVVVAAVLTPLLAEGGIAYNLDQLSPLERQLRPLVYDVFSVCYFGADPVYTQIPTNAAKYWERARSHPTHPLDFVITYIKVTRFHQDDLDVHCVGWLTLIDESGDGKITGTVYAEWDLAFSGNGPWSTQPASDPGAKPVLAAFNESSSSDFVKECGPGTP